MRFRFLFVLLCLVVGQSFPAHGVIRDAEIEDALHEWMTPLARAGGVDEKAVRLILLSDQSINAFVTQGNHLFIHSGLLMATDNADEVKGVLAHELGHIAGGHLLRLHDAYERASIWGIFSLLLGAAAIASGQADVGMATLTALPHANERLFLSEIRHNEYLADQSAVSYLHETHQSVGGLHSFLEKMAEKEGAQDIDIDPYLLTHPLSEERVRLAEEALSHEEEHCCPSPQDDEKHGRIRAKLRGFLLPPDKVRAHYHDDFSFSGRYARAIMHHRAGDLTQAINIADDLLAEKPHDPYLHELKGQFLFEHGKLEDAVRSYARAAELSDNHPLILLGWVQAALALDNEDLLFSIRLALDNILQKEKENGMAWHLYSIAAGREGDMGVASLALAERSLIWGEIDHALRHAQRADRILQENSPHKQRAKDILSLLSEG